MKQIVDDYVAKDKDEEAGWKEKKASMQKVIDKMIDAEGKESAVDEMLKMEKAHDKKLEEYVAFIRSTDEAVKTLTGDLGGDWKDEHPETKSAVEEIYQKYPAVLLRLGV